MARTGKGRRLLAVSKQAFFRRMDKLSGDRDAVQAALRDLTRKPDASLLDLGVVHAYVRGAAEAEHVRDDWLAAGSGWWQELPDTEPILRAAFIKAAELILKHRLPLDCYWVQGTEEFQVLVCKSRQQITMLVCSPLPPIAAVARKMQVEPSRDQIGIWVFGAGTSTRQPLRRGAATRTAASRNSPARGPRTR